MKPEPAGTRPRRGRAPSRRQPAFALIGLLVLANGVLWAAVLFQFRTAPALLGIALVVYGLGLRHAIDVDHIAAIDNITRKLIHDGQKPIATGFYFALGHSSIVLVVTALAAWLSARVTAFERYRDTAGLVGAAFSTIFFLSVAVLNLHLFLGLVWARPAALHPGGGAHPQRAPAFAGGLLARLLARVLRLVTRSRDMFLVGLLFGLGFDTASEVTLIGTSAVQFANGLPFSSVLLFPLLFTSAMALVDTADGVVMLKVYHWALVRPERTRIYNGAITLISALISVLLAGAAGCELVRQSGLGAGLLAPLDIVKTRSEAFGLGLTAALLACWTASRLSRMRSPA